MTYSFDDFKAAVSRLPQAKMIREDDARAWFESASKSSKGLRWHFNRLMGVGGSDAGSILDWHRGQPSPFASARDIWNQKLMRVPIQDYIGYAPIEGTAMEESLRQRFRALYEAQALEVPKSATRDGHLVGNPDDVVRIGGEVILVDYKHPQDREPPSEVPLGYVAQLHHYRRILQNRAPDLTPERMVLCYTNKRAEPHGFSSIEVPYNEALDQELQEACKLFWSAVLSGEPPAMKRRASAGVVLTDDQKAEIGKLDWEVAAAKTIESVAKESSTRAQQRLAAAITAAGIPSEDLRPVIRTSGVTVRTSAPDEAIVKERMIAAGIDQKAVMSPGDYDVEALVSLAAKHGASPNEIDACRRQVFDPEKAAALYAQRGLGEVPSKTTLVWSAARFAKSSDGQELAGQAAAALQKLIGKSAEAEAAIDPESPGASAGL